MFLICKYNNIFVYLRKTALYTALSDGVWYGSVRVGYLMDGYRDSLRIPVVELNIL